MEEIGFDEDFHIPSDTLNIYLIGDAKRKEEAIKLPLISALHLIGEDYNKSRLGFLIV